MIHSKQQPITFPDTKNVSVRQLDNWEITKEEEPNERGMYVVKYVTKVPLIQQAVLHFRQNNIQFIPQQKYWNIIQIRRIWGLHDYLQMLPLMFLRNNKLIPHISQHYRNVCCQVCDKGSVDT